MPNAILPQSEWQTKYACAHQKVSSLNVGLPRGKQTRIKRDVMLKIKGFITL